MTRSDAAAIAENSEDDRLIAALLLRDARAQGERAEEEGNAAYFCDAKKAPRVNERLLKGEIAQARSHNKRCGVDTASLPAMPPDKVFGSEAQRQSSALEREFIRRAHSIREGYSTSTTAAISAIGDGTPCVTKKRQRVGVFAVGKRDMDVATAELEEAKQADEDVALANPLLRPPPSSSASSVPSNQKRKQSASPLERESGWGEAVVGTNHDKNSASAMEPTMWVSRRLKVRIVDETGDLKKYHLKKAVVCRVDSAKHLVTIELDDAGSGARRELRSVPESCLETVVSKACSRVEIVRGPHRGLTAELLERNTRENIAVVRLSRGFDSAEMDLPLDSVCEFA